MKLDESLDLEINIFKVRADALENDRFDYFDIVLRKDNEEVPLFIRDCPETLEETSQVIVDLLEEIYDFEHLDPSLFEKMLLKFVSDPSKEGESPVELFGLETIYDHTSLSRTDLNYLAFEVRERLLPYLEKLSLWKNRQTEVSPSESYF